MTTLSQYQAFGSFHTESVDALLKKNPSEDNPLPKAITLLRESHVVVDITSSPLLPAKDYFLLNSPFTFLNHGAFGASLKSAVSEKRVWEDVMESQPLRFMDRQLFPWLVQSIRSVAKLIHIPHDRASELALLSNATLSLNTVITHYIRSPADVVVVFDLTYGSSVKMVRARCNAVGGARVVVVPIEFDFDKDIALSAEVLCSRIPANASVVLIDHVLSATGSILPVSQLIPLIRAKCGTECKIIVDGAHTPLQLDLNLGDGSLTPDCYLGNLHKWVCGPKATGFLWCPKQDVRSIVISHGYGAGYSSEFIWEGCKDYGAALTLPGVIQFWEKTIGIHNVREYCTKLRKKATSLLSNMWNVTLLQHQEFGWMETVPLPSSLRPDRVSDKYIQDTLHFRYNVEVPVKWLGERLYVRISCMVYNSISEYETLGKAVLEIAQKIGAKL